MSNTKLYFWSAVNRFGIQAISFIGNVLVARQLSPDDYGLVAMLSIVLGLAWNFTDSGFSDCLIRKTNADKKDFGTILTFNIVVGTTMYFIIYTTAPLVAKYFDRNELIDISRIIGLSILIKALSTTEFTRLKKELQFKTTTIIELTSQTTAVIVAYIMALKGYGYWALVIQTLTIGLANIVMLIFLTKWRPYLCFSWTRYKTMSGYSLDLLLSYITNQIGSNLYSVFIGKFQTGTSLGYYRQAWKIKDAPISGLNAIILSTTYPLLANESDENKRYKMYVSLFNRFLSIQFLIVAILFGIAQPLIDLLFGEKWLESAPYFQLMLVASLFYPVTTLNQNLAKIYGKSQLYRNLTFLRNSLLLVALFFTMRSSIPGILYGQIIASYISVVIDSFLCGRIVNLGFKKQIKIVFIQLWIPFTSLLVAYYTVIHINNSSLYILTFTVVFFFVYILLNETTKQQLYLGAKSSIINRTKKTIQKLKQ
jgi:O-antigen/teichoic acid export membrane protein